MDETQVKLVIEAALLAAGRPLPLDTLASLFSSKASDLDKETLTTALDALAQDYRDRGLELKEVASGYRIQIRSSMSDWLTPLWEERAPRYTRALLETLALIVYRQPITRAEIEEVRGVAVSSNIIRTLMERNWIRVVGHRDVPGKPAMFGTTRDFLDYFGLKKLEDLPALADIKDGLPELHPQTDFLEAIVAPNEDGQAGNGNADASEGAEAASMELATEGPEASASEADEHVESADEAELISSMVAASGDEDDDDDDEDEDEDEDDEDDEDDDDEDDEDDEDEDEDEDEEDDDEDYDDDEEESANFVVVEALTTYVEDYSDDENRTHVEHEAERHDETVDESSAASFDDDRADGEPSGLGSSSSEDQVEAAVDAAKIVEEDLDLDGAIVPALGLEGSALDAAPVFEGETEAASQAEGVRSTGAADTDAAPDDDAGAHTDAATDDPNAAADGESDAVAEEDAASDERLSRVEAG